MVCSEYRKCVWGLVFLKNVLRFLISFALIITTILGGITVSADETQEKKVKDAGFTAEQAHVIVEVWNALKKEGYSDEGAAGILGNIGAESSYNPAITEVGNGIGFGLIQWSFGRRTELEQAAFRKGKLPTDLGFQIDYLLKDLKNTSFEYGTGYSIEKDIKKATSVDHATEAFEAVFERAGVKRMDVRTSEANKCYKALKGTASGVTSASGSAKVTNKGKTNNSENSSKDSYSRGDSPFKDGRQLTYDEQKRVDDIIEELNNENEMTKWGSLFSFVALAGLCLIVYSLILLLAFYIDILNTMTDFSIIGMLSFGRLHAVSSKAEQKSMKNSDDSGTRKYISHRDIWIIFAVGIMSSTLLLNGRVVYLWIVKLFNWIMGIFS